MRKETANHTPGLFMTLRYTAAGASSRVRGIQLAAALESAGTDVAVLTPDDPRWKTRYYGSVASRRVLYIQKRVSARDAFLMRVRRALGRHTIFDLDDAPGSVAEDPAQETLVAGMMRLASAVTVGGHQLHAFARRHNDVVEIIPSAVDTALYRPEQLPDRLATIGWVGNGAGYSSELLHFARVVARVRERVRARVMIVGAMGRPEIHAAFAHEDDVVVDAVDWTNESAIVGAMREFDIGAYPLHDTPYNSFKCGYKAIQYMALGLPVAASPVGENTYIIGDGVSGYLPRTDDEWVSRLSDLVRDPAGRHRLGQAGRDAVVERYSLDVAARSLRSLLERIVRA